MPCCTTFDPDTWGTVSDWFMFAVTALTGYGVYQTLKSQSKTLRLQTKINKSDNIRLTKEIKPVFTLKETFTERLAVSDPEVSLETWFTNTGDYSAKNFIVVIKEGGYRTQWDIHPNIPYEKDVIDPQESFGFTLFGSLDSYNTGQGSLTIATIAFILRYSDVKGNEYEQEYFFTVNNKSKTSYLTAPKAK